MKPSNSMSPAQGDRATHAHRQGTLAALALLDLFTNAGEAISASEAAALLCDELGGLLDDAGGDPEIVAAMIVGFSGPMAEAARVAATVVAFLKSGAALPGVGGTVQ